jgi:hypothetical protein
MTSDLIPHPGPRRSGTSLTRALLTGLVLPMAAVLGLAALGLAATAPAAAQLPPTNPTDKALATMTTTEDVPTVAINPASSAALAMSFARAGGCFVRTSADGGTTWTTPVRLRASVAGGTCVSAEIAFAPDGSRLYAAYAEWGPQTGTWQLNRILVAVSSDGGRTWGAPATVLQGSSDPNADAFLQPQVATPLHSADAKWVYVTAVQHYRYGAATKFARSETFGSTWTVTASVGIRHRYAYELLPPLQATRHTLAAGPGSEVMLVNACGGCDDADYPDGIARDQGVRVWRSTNYGAGFITGIDPPVYAQRGPLAYRFPANVAWGWGETAVGPAVAYGIGGTAHVIYPANGRLHYIWARPPYTAWSVPEMVDDNSAGAKETPVLQVRACGSTTYLHALWYDGRRDATGRRYDVFYARRPAAAGGVWSNNARVSNATSYPELPWSSTGIAVNGGSVFAVWPDRRDNGGYDLDIFGSPIVSGLTCP